MTHPVLACIDMGTTRTRVWVMKGEQILNFAAGDFGARDTARKGRDWLREQLLRLVRGTGSSDFAVSAGMITSAQGLQEVLHVLAPASVADLANGMQKVDVDGLPVWLIPGVRTDEIPGQIVDIMRGEETLCAGLLDVLEPKSWVLTLGSHWKWIYIDAERRIARSVTSLAGELIHALQTNTILAASLPQERPGKFDDTWVSKGVAAGATGSFGETLFRTRLLDLSGLTTEVQRLSYVYGVVLSSEIHSAERLLSSHPGPVLVSGTGVLAEVWRKLLNELKFDVSVLPERSRDDAFLKGLSLVVAASHEPIG